MNVIELFGKFGLKVDKASFTAADKMLAGLKTALVGVATYAGARMFTGMVQDAVALGSNLNDLAASTGLTRSTLQELGYVADQSGSSMGELGSTLGKLSRNLGEAATKGGEQAKAFKRAGIAIKDATGQVRPAADVLEDIADHISSLSDDDKPAAAMRLLGRGAASMIPFLNNGSKGIRELRTEARELGVVLSDDAVQGLDDFGDQQAKVSASLKSLKTEAVAALLPALREMADGMLTWVKANRAWLKQRIVDGFQALVKVARVVGKVLGVALDALKWLTDHPTLVATVLLGIAAAFVALRAAAIGAAIASAVAGGLMLLPFVLLGVAIAAVVLIIQDLIVGLSGGNSLIMDMFTESQKTGGGMLGTFGQVLDVFVKIGKAIAWVIDKVVALKDGLADIGRNSVVKKLVGGAGFDMIVRGKQDVDAAADRAMGNVQMSADQIAAERARRGLPPAAVSARTPTAAGGGNTANITINAGSANPAEVAERVRAVVREQLGTELRIAGSVGAQ